MLAPQAAEKARQEKMERERVLQRKKAEELKRKKELKRQMLEEIEEQKRKEFAAQQHEKVACRRYLPTDVATACCLRTLCPATPTPPPPPLDSPLNSRPPRST